MPQEHKFILEIRSKGFKQTKKETKQVEGSIAALRKQVRQHKRELDKAVVGTKEFKNAQNTLEHSTKQLNTALKKVTKNVAGYSFGAKNMRGVTSGLRRSIGALRNNLLLISFTLGAVVAAISKFVGASRQFEDVKTRLVGLTGSVERAEEAFRIFNKVAATTPFSLADVVEAGAQLKAFGADAEALIKPISDLAAFMGTTAVEAANAFGRAYAGGAGAADILRERGILNIIKSSQGLTDLSKTTLPDFREALISTLSDPIVGIEGSTERLSKTFTGAFSNMGDAMLRASAAFGDLLIDVLNLKESAGGLTKVFSDIANAISDLVDTPIESLKRKFQELGLDTTNLKDGLEELSHANTVLSFDATVEAVEKASMGLRDYDSIMKNFELNKKWTGDTRKFIGTWQDLSDSIKTTQTDLLLMINTAASQKEWKKANKLTNEYRQLEDVLSTFAHLVPEVPTLEEMEIGGDLEVDDDKEIKKRTDKHLNELHRRFAESTKFLAKWRDDQRKIYINYEAFRDQLGKTSLEKAIMKLEHERLLARNAASEMIKDKESLNTKLLEIDETYAQAKDELRTRDSDKETLKMDQMYAAALQQFERMTGSFQKNLDARVSYEISALKETERYKMADTERRKDMERDVKKEFAKQQMILFRFDQASALAHIGMDTAEAIMRAVALIPPSGGFMTPMIATMGAAQAAAVLAQKPPSFAQGGDFITSGPQMIMVGDNASGRERVTITPSEQSQSFSRNLTVNITGNVMSENYTRDQIIPQIRDALRFDLA